MNAVAAIKKIPKLFSFFSHTIENFLGQIV